ncbi:LLM class flavin-dependent oxidoreductase [Amycolatopsis nivea]|uniref:LLM class flavin-dependent oxidoreductase n=1 Tax=Amycolatopsis nivea TaxID=1644109 RepID=UPI00106FEF99|nr:LLM class flavin-dependent oxidoreductase [Amycolatopsis nivea]
MADYGHDLQFGVVLLPETADPSAVTKLAEAADRAGLDLLSVPDHPYRPDLLDAWTVLSVVVARTERLRVFPNVANLPLRPPAVLARSVASLDLLSGGRTELALGTGAYWDDIAAQGGPRYTPGEAFDALAEAIEVIRALWTPGPPAHVSGAHHRLAGTPPGPFPAHRMETWLGALGPRMLRLIGRTADGWLPSMTRIPPDRLPAANALIDEAARKAGRSPGEIRRLYNLPGIPSGSTGEWADQLADLTLTHGMSAFLLSADSADAIRLFAREVAPQVRELVAVRRQSVAAAGGNGQRTRGPCF